MQLLFLTRRFFPDIGGVESHILEISKILAKKGHSITIITESHFNDRQSFKFYRQQKNIKVVSINAGYENWFKKFRVWKALYKFKNIINDADIVHCHDVFYWYLPFRIIYPFKKVYITFHGYEGVFPPRNSAIWIRKVSEKLSNGNICVGEYITRWYRTKANYIIYGGVKVNQKTIINHQKQNSKLKITLIGRFEKDIGVLTYINALERLKIKNINIDFSAFGNGSLGSKLRLHGKIFESTMNIDTTIKNADIIFASSYLIMFQALIARKIVIAVYDNPLKEDYLKMSPFINYIYICKDADEVAGVVIDIFKNSWKSESMVSSGYNWAKDQTWEKVTNTYFNLWK